MSNGQANVDVKKLRSQLRLTQTEFADRFGLSVATLRYWEQGRGRPDCAARALLAVISRSPEAVDNALKATA